MTKKESKAGGTTGGRDAEAGVKVGRRKGEEGEAVGSGVLGRAEAGKRKKVGSAKARKKARKKGPEGRPVEEVTMTAEEEKELKRWLASKMRVQPRRNTLGVRWLLGMAVTRVAARPLPFARMRKAVGLRATMNETSEPFLGGEMGLRLKWLRL